MKKCILHPGKICNDCGECDDRCSLDPRKPCTNCFKCLEPQEEYATIPIDEILMETDESAFVDSKEAELFTRSEGVGLYEYHAVCPKHMRGSRRI